MKIKPRTKKIIVISSGSILVIALFVWYFFPVLLANWFWYQHDSLRQYLSSTPIPIIALKTPPKEWKSITIDNLTMKLPMFEYTKVSGKETYMRFISGKGSVLVFDIVPQKVILEMIKENRLKYPVVSYRDYLAIFSSMPADVSFFNSRNKNTTALSDQMLKVVAITTIARGGLSKVLTVDTGTLKALCILSEKRDKGYSATAFVYSQNEKVSISLILQNYQDKSTLEADLLAILGGIKMPDHMCDFDQVSKDINRIVTKFKKT